MPIKFLLCILQLKYPSFTIKNETAKGGRIEIEAHRSKFFIKLSLKQENDSVKMAVEKIQALRLLYVFSYFF